MGTLDSLADTSWDVLISGTGLQQSLLALALSRSGKKILHVDKNQFYGGPDAALSLQEAEEWAKKVEQGVYALQETHASLVPEAHQVEDSSSTETFSNASISRAPEEAQSSNPTGPKLSYSRAYSLSLSPGPIYTRSSLLPVLVSSRVYRQLEFQAVGHWWILDDAGHSTVKGLTGPSSETTVPQTESWRLHKVPNGREDIFADGSIDLKSKRTLMKFLKFVGSYEDQRDAWEPHTQLPFPRFLSDSFGLSLALHPPLLAIAMSSEPNGQTSTDFAVPRIARHLRSIGVFGPSFGAVVPKWGGGSEIAQVACRACAVGGGVYVLGQAVESMSDISPSSEEESTNQHVKVQLQGGDTVKARWIVGAQEDLPEVDGADITQEKQTSCLKSISIVSSSLSSLFQVTAEGGPPPAAAVVTISSAGMLNDSSEKSMEQLPPIYIIVHSSDTGECPPGQCVLYASILADDGLSHSNLDEAVRALLESMGAEDGPEVLYTLHYTQSGPLPDPGSAGEESFQAASPVPSASAGPRTDSRVLLLPPPSLDLAFDDGMVDRVRAIWEQITSDLGDEDSDEQDFMVFEDREERADDAG